MRQVVLLGTVDTDFTVTIHAFTNSDAFDYNKTINLAWLATNRDTANIPRFVDLLTSKDPVHRYWGAQGLLILGEKSAAKTVELNQLLKDSHAANRITAEGQVVAPEERLSLGAALRAITLGAAELLRAEDEIGSIEAGKHADFTVLERDPYEVPLAELHQIPIWGTVFQGRPYPLER